MEDLQRNNFEVNSSVHGYQVFFDISGEWIIDAGQGDAIIIDKTVYENTPMSGFDGVIIIPIEAKEENKEYTAVSKYIQKLIDSGFRRDNTIYAVGGGVIQDISGFIASMLYRGVEWYYFPTTLLAQGDSCIGGKTSINVGDYKNQVGGFYPPHIVVIDISYLETLPKNQITSGLGEMAHYFLIEGGKDLEFFKEFDFENRMQEIIRRSLSIKKKMIELDEFDKGPRIVFNYGHSFGHAIETVTNYKIPHGIAVAYGMDMANYVSYRLGFVDEGFVNEALYILKEFFGDWEIRKIMIDICHDDSYISDKLIPALKRDKKNKGNNLGLILTRGFGDMFLEYVAPEDIEAHLKEYFKKRLND